MSKAPISVLVLENEGIIRAGMMALIQAAEPACQVTGVGAYDEAIDVLRINRFDIAFLDFHLDDNCHTGLDILKHIRETGLKTACIMLSAHDARDHVMHCLKVGASGFIPKAMAYGDGPGGVFRQALSTIFQGGIFLPTSVFGRGGYSPTQGPVTDTVDPLLGLSARHLETLYYLCQGLDNKSIARAMKISDETVRKDYNTRIYQHFKVARRAELIVEVARRGLKIPRPDSPTPIS